MTSTRVSTPSSTIATRAGTRAGARGPPPAKFHPRPTHRGDARGRRRRRALPRYRARRHRHGHLPGGVQLLARLSSQATHQTQRRQPRRALLAIAPSPAPSTSSHHTHMDRLRSHASERKRERRPNANEKEDAGRLARRRDPSRSPVASSPFHSLARRLDPNSRPPRTHPSRVRRRSRRPPRRCGRTPVRVSAGRVPSLVMVSNPAPSTPSTKPRRTRSSGSSTEGRVAELTAAEVFVAARRETRATVLTHPVLLVKSRLQRWATDGSRHAPPGTLDAARRTFRERVPRRSTAGLHARCRRAAAALMFAAGRRYPARWRRRAKTRRARRVG